MIKNSTKEVYFSKNSNNSIKYIINLEKNLVDRWRLEKKVSLGSNLGWSFMKFGISEKKNLIGRHRFLWGNVSWFKFGMKISWDAGLYEKTMIYCSNLVKI